MNIVMNLQGQWQFRLDKEKKGLVSHFENQTFEDTITLPTTVSEAKKGTPHHRTDTGHLTDPYEMEGYSWYRKTVSLPMKDLSELSGKHIELTLERTRISYVWVDGEFAGSFDSFVARHSYDLTGMIKTLNPSVTVMVSNTDYKVPGGHMTSPDTQTNWNGILGEIFLTIREGIRLGNVAASCDFDRKGILLSVPVQYDGENFCPARIQVQPVLCRLKDVYAAQDKIIPADGNYEDFVNRRPLPDEAGRFDVTLRPGKNRFELFLDLSASAKLWDEEDPYVYRLHLSCRKIPADSADSGTDVPFDIVSVWCGIRSFTAGETHFYINGRKTFLRGKHDGMIFPMTGYAPMDVAGWLHVMKIAKDYGINHYRFHTCCPPEAAFVAADLLGIYMQPEISFWGTFNGPEDEGYDGEAQKFLEAEGFRMLEAFSGHPSFCMMSMGNELWGNAAALDELLAKYKAFRPYILFTQGSNNFFWTPNILPHDDFFSGVRFTVDRQIRGSYAMCDAPLGHVQTAVPGTRFNYAESIRPSYSALSSAAANRKIAGDAACEEPAGIHGTTGEALNNSEKAAPSESEEKTVEIQYGTGVKRVRLSEVQGELIPKVPVISHEIGQYEIYPDFDEILQYTGVLKPRNLEEFRRRLDKNKMLFLARDFFLNSGALAVACYRDELETALRSSSQLAGFQLLDLQDFTGQGTALVGILNAFMENKGLISAADWRRFCAAAVIQAEFDSYVVVSENPFEFTVSLSYFKKSPITCDSLVCSLTDGDNNVISCLNHSVTALTQNGCSQGNHGCIGNNDSQGNHALGNFCLKLPKVNAPTWLTLTIELSDSRDAARGKISNSYRLWLYPEYKDVQSQAATARQLKELPELAKKHRVCLLFLPEEENRASIEGTYCTDFWCYPMFRDISINAGKDVPVGTMGLLIRKEHEALRHFPCETFTTPQWHSIVNASRSTILDDTDLVPIVQTIDNFDRNHRLGLIYELYLKDLDLGVLVCTSDLPLLMENGQPESFALYQSLQSYLPELEEKRRQTCALTYDEFCSLLFSSPAE